MQKTLFIIKPDAVKRHLVGQVIDRIERRGFTIERMEMLTLDLERLKKHYAQLVDKPFFSSITNYMMSGPAIIGILSGPGVIKSWRDMMGATNPGEALLAQFEVTLRPHPMNMVYKILFMVPIQKSLLLAKSSFGLVNNMDLKQIQNDIVQGGLLIDVRSPEEYAEGHVKDALLIPHTQFFTADIPAKKDDSIYLYCKMGPRADFAAAVLHERGYSNVTNLGGLDDMEALGFEFVL